MTAASHLRRVVSVDEDEDVTPLSHFMCEMCSEITTTGKEL